MQAEGQRRASDTSTRPGSDVGSPTMPNHGLGKMYASRVADALLLPATGGANSPSQQTEKKEQRASVHKAQQLYDKNQDRHRSRDVTGGTQSDGAGASLRPLGADSQTPHQRPLPLTQHAQQPSPNSSSSRAHKKPSRRSAGGSRSPERQEESGTFGTYYNPNSPNSPIISPRPTRGDSGSMAGSPVFADKQRKNSLPHAIDPRHGSGSGSPTVGVATPGSPAVTPSGRVIHSTFTDSKKPSRNASSQEPCTRYCWCCKKTIKSRKVTASVEETFHLNLN